MTSTETTGPDNSGAFNLDDELPPIVLNGLSRYGIDEGTVVPEPSQGRLTKFRQLLFLMTRPPQIANLSSASDDELVEYMMSRDWTRTTRLELDAWATLCGGDPPRDDKGNDIARPEAPKEPDRPDVDAYRGPAAEDGTPGPLDDEAYETAVKAWRTRHGQWKTNHRKYTERLDAWEAKWTGGNPTRQQLEQLPGRARSALFGYLGGKFMDPQVAAGADTST